MSKVVYLMRGLPSSGKSHTARGLAGEGGTVCETDRYFHTEVGEDPECFDYRAELLDAARRWNFARFERALAKGLTPVVVDRGNSLSVETRRYADRAMEAGYAVALAEPESEWWQELRVLLKYKRFTRPVLERWAEALAEMSRATHGVPVDVIRRRMARWKWDLSVDDILRHDPQTVAAPPAEPGPAVAGGPAIGGGRGGWRVPSSGPGIARPEPLRDAFGAAPSGPGEAARTASSGEWLREFLTGGDDEDEEGRGPGGASVARLDPRGNDDTVGSG